MCIKKYKQSTKKLRERQVSNSGQPVFCTTHVVSQPRIIKLILVKYVTKEHTIEKVVDKSLFGDTDTQAQDLNFIKRIILLYGL